PLGKEIYLSERYDHTGLVTFAENVEAFDGTASRWASFANGINAWHDAVAQRRSPSVLSDVFDRLHVLWAQSLHVRALGALLVAIASELPGLSHGVERTLTVEFPDKKEQRLYSAARAGIAPLV